MSLNENPFLGGAQMKLTGEFTCYRYQRTNRSAAQDKVQNFNGFRRWGGGNPGFFPPDFFSRKNVTKILFKLEVTGLVLAKSRKLGVARAHPTCAEISVSKIFLLP